MPRVAVFMVTRDRLDYTKRTFVSLFKNPGIEFKLFVFDNGSKDQTHDWLNEKKFSGHIWLNTKNYGLHIAANKCIDWIKKEGEYDYILKVDNDIEFETDEWLKKLISAHEIVFENQVGVSAPNIKGLMFPPPRHKTIRKKRYKFGFSGILGGICRLHPISLFDEFRFNERLPLATGGDVELADYCRIRKIPMVYVENIVAWHMDTTEKQIKEKEDYFDRSSMERYIPYGA